MQELRIDPEFERIIPPLTADEFQMLEENILAEGKVRDALVIWNGFIIDGHNRYKIIQMHPELPYTTEEKNFADREEAIWWMCGNQLGRRNLTEYQWDSLLGRRYKTEKRSYGSNDGFRGNQYTDSVSGNPCHLPQGHTAVKIGREFGVSPRKVRYAGNFVDGLDAAEEEIPGITQEILSGKIKPTKKDVMAIGREKDEEARRQLAEDLRKPKRKKNKAAAEASVPEEQDVKDEVADDSFVGMPRAEARALYRNIEAISADMAKPKEAITLDDVLIAIDGAVKSFQSNCDFFFGKYPELLRADGCREKTIRIISKLKKYITRIEGEGYSEKS